MARLERFAERILTDRVAVVYPDKLDAALTRHNCRFAQDASPMLRAWRLCFKLKCQLPSLEECGIRWLRVKDRQTAAEEIFRELDELYYNLSLDYYQRRH